jgi:hypothetical protein
MSKKCDGWSVGWLVGRPVGSLVGLLVGLSSGWSVGWSVDWLGSVGLGGWLRVLVVRAEHET